MAEIITLPTARPRLIEPMANDYGHEPVAPVERPRIDITPGVDGYRVWLFGRVYAEFASSTSATRCAAALTTLDALDALPWGDPTTPTAA